MPTVEFLAAHHDRSSFDCGKEPLNRYIRETARQNANRNLGVTQVIVPSPNDALIMGYFTLLTRTVEAEVLQEKRLPHGPLGIALLGRLAVDVNYQGQGLGKRILLRAMAETDAASHKVGIFALVLDALDDSARTWYLSLDFGFKPILDDPNRLYVTVGFIQQLYLGTISDEL
jgi:GNAT superfamily N-acetyltransferase